LDPRSRTSPKREPPMIDHAKLLADQIVSVNERIDDMKAKREMLRQRLLETTVVDSAAFRRLDPSNEEIVAWVQKASAQGRGIGINGMSTAALEGLGMTKGELMKIKWDLDHAWPEDQKHGGGSAEWSDETRWPRTGPTVYALFDVFGNLSYVGRTGNFRSRLKTHRREKGATNVDTWEAWSCSSDAEMRDLEAILIDQHQPTLNKRPESRNGAAV
jgi:hypothetical protein